MSLTVQDQVRRITYGTQGRLEQLRRLRRRLLDRFALSRALFYAPDGNLKAEAVEWLAELAANNFVQSSAFHVDPVQHAYNSARRDLALEIIQSVQLDTAKLDALNAQEAKEMTNGGR